METDLGHTISPTTILAHELDHNEDATFHPEEHEARRKIEDPQTRNAEEKRVMTGSEQRVAEKLGEVKKGEKVRETHTHNKNKTVITEGWDSNKKK